MGAEMRKTMASWGAGLLLLAAPAWSQGVVVEYFHTDAVGNVLALTSGSGAVVESHDYYPFGEEWCAGVPCSTVTAGQAKRFTGKERDAETGLDYFGARYYGSRIGRFTTVDPVYNWNANLVDPQRWNRYAYGRNNPLRYVDPNGEDAFDVAAGALTAFGSNLQLGANRPVAYNSDFALGQSIGDLASIGAGLYETFLGSGVATEGGLLTVTGAGAPVGLAVAAVGVGVAAHGVGVSASGLIHLSKNVGEPGGPKVGSEGGAGAGKRFSDKTKDAARAENSNCVFCDRPTTREAGPTQSNIDHAKAKARAGNNTAENAQNTCRECNQRKGTKSSEEFVKR